MKFFTIAYLVLVPLAWSSPADKSEYRTGRGHITFSWVGDRNKAPAYCKGFREFTSRLVLTPLSGRSNLFGDGNHARIEYYLSVDTDFGVSKELGIDVKTTDMEFLFSLSFPPRYDENWEFKLLSTSSSEVLGVGYTVTGFYHSSGKLEVDDDGKKITLGWRSGGDGFRIDSNQFEIHGKMYREPSTDASGGYCLMKWSERKQR